ncbi:MAG TPA: ABC transporter permease [Acidimicrobiia bacterium]|nr:ABC transporter permease [Acidimicrobiia bacterium]
MLSTLGAAMRTVVRRLVTDWVIVGAVFITVLLSAGLLAAGPIYADAVTISALQRTLEDAPVTEANVNVALKVFPDYYAAADESVRGTVEESFATTGAEVFAHMEADAYGIEGAGEGDRADLASIEFFEDIENRATIVVGSWPTTDDNTEVALNSPAATALGVSVGDSVTVVNRRDPSLSETLQIVGIYQSDDPTDPFWFEDELASVGEVESPSFRTLGPFVVARESLLENFTPQRVNADWRVLPRFEDLTVSEVDVLRTETTDLARNLTDDLYAVVDPVASGTDAGFTVTTGLPNLLDDIDRSLTVTRSSVLAVLVQLAILAGYALVLTAGLLTDTRRGETVLSRSRGSSPAQLVSIALIEALIITLPAIALGPLLATALLEILNAVGPLATVGLQISPEPTVEGYALAIVAAILSIVALTWPAYRSARRFGVSGSRHRRQQSRWGPQRIGLDLAFVAIAVVAFWQLQELGPQISLRVRGQFGVDPLLVIAPALALLAGAVIALRIVPLLAHVAEWLASSGRATVSALAAWQVARRPTRYARASLLLMMAVSIGFFAAAYATTWTQSQIDQASHQVGADLRVVPNRAVGASLPDLQLRSTQEDVTGIASSMPAVRLSGELPGEGGLGQIVVLDADVASDVVLLRQDLGADFGPLMAMLAERRPTLGSVEIPGEPETVVLGVEATEDIPDENPHCGSDPTGPDACFLGKVWLVVQDGNGLLHRLEGAFVAPNEGLVEIPIELVTRLADGGTARPTYPISIVNIEVQSFYPEAGSRSVTLDFSGFTALYGDGSSAPAAADQDWTTWTTSVTDVISVAGRPTIGSPTPDDDGGVTVQVETGYAFGVPPATFSIRPPGTSLPDSIAVVVSSTFPEATLVGVGDTVRLPPLRIAEDTVTITGTLDAFPTIDPDLGEFVLVDLPTYQMMGYEPGNPIRPVDQYWMSVDGDPDEALASVLAPPLATFSAESLQELTDQLTSDPVALGTIGALTVGFVAAAVFAAVGFAVSATVSARERLVEFALLRALGLSPRQLGGWLVLEQSVLVVVSLALGTFVGWLITTTVLPLVTLTQDGSQAFPPVIVEYPWAAISVLELAVVAVLAVIVIVMTFILRRVGLGSLLRMGED